MANIAKLAVLVAAAIGPSSAPDLANPPPSARAQISPLQMMRAVGVLPEMKIQSYEWVFPVL
jgi:hypothetical protein